MIGKTIHELRAGDVAEVVHHVDADGVAEFVDAVGDHNPIHSDPEYAASTPFKEPIAPGVFTAGLISAAIGTKLPGPGAVYISQTMNFMAPVLIGETITAVATITAIDDKRRRVTLKTQCLNGDKVVIDGEATVLVPRRDAA